MEVQYQRHVFGFEPGADDPFTGRLVLDDTQRELLAQLLANEDDDWCLDADGERLPNNELFNLTPWSCAGPNGTIKLLCRFLDLSDGTVLFNTLETYPGDVWRWMRQRGDSPPDEDGGGLMRFRVVVRPIPSATPLDLEALASSVSAWKEVNNANWADRLEGLAAWTRGLSAQCVLTCEGNSAEQIGRSLVEALPNTLAETTTVEVGRE